MIVLQLTKKPQIESGKFQKYTRSWVVGSSTSCRRCTVIAGADKEKVHKVHRVHRKLVTVSQQLVPIKVIKGTSKNWYFGRWSRLTDESRDGCTNALISPKITLF